MPRGRRGKKSDSVLFKSAEWIGWALGGLEREIEETRERLKVLTDQAAALRSRVGVAARRGVAAAVGANPAGQPPGPSQRGPKSAEGRRRMSAIMKKRWQEAKKKNRNRL